ncbi:hypothetical protein D3C84_1231030 [compost metagenome]
MQRVGCNFNPEEHAVDPNIEKQTDVLDSVLPHKPLAAVHFIEVVARKIARCFGPGMGHR